MPIALIFAGSLLLIAAVRDTQQDLYALVKKDLIGPNNFIQWMVAIVLIGSIGYIPKLKGFSAALLALVLVAIFLKRGTGFFDQLTATLETTTKA
jgi:hypothetical protein